MADLHGIVSWPGIISPTGLDYTISHGITPGTACLRCNPQSQPFALEGDLSWTDGVNGDVTLTRCKVDRVESRVGANGTEWLLYIYDRRWRWRDCGWINLFANQLDPHSKFVPWTIRSPREVAELCLLAMGETGYDIDLPTGLSRRDGQGIKEFLSSGVNFPPSGVNPPIDWYYDRPMAALQQFAESMGRVLVFRWKTNSVLIAKRSDGALLPPGSIYTLSPSVNDPETPDGIAVAGAPTRYQVDLPVQAVGEEWNGVPKPISSLSYAPQRGGKFHVVNITGSFALDFLYHVTINGVRIGQNGVDYPGLLTNFVTAINANPDLSKILTAVSDGTTITLTGKVQGDQFSVDVDVAYGGAVDPPPADPDWEADVQQIGQAGKGDWSRSFPPMWPGIRATDRLTLSQAREKANKSVWKWYQVTGQDASGVGLVEVPGYGRIVRRQQLVLLDTQCEQIVPDAGDDTIRDRAGVLFIQNLYDGYSRDKPAVAIGSVHKNLTPHVRYFLDRSNPINTARDEIVQAGITVDNVWQIMKFSTPIYKWGVGGQGVMEPDLVLRTAVHVRDKDTNQVEAYFQYRRFPGREGNDFVVEKHDDIQVNVIPEYAGLTRTILSVRTLEADPDLRAKYYLDAMQLRYQVEAALTAGYNGIVPIDLDGAIAQVTWRIGEGGCETIASRNYEHDKWVPPAARRFREEAMRSAAQPGGFLGMVGDRADPTIPAPMKKR